MRTCQRRRKQKWARIINLRRDSCDRIFDHFPFQLLHYLCLTHCLKTFRKKTNFVRLSRCNERFYMLTLCKNITHRGKLLTHLNATFMSTILHIYKMKQLILSPYIYWKHCSIHIFSYCLLIYQTVYFFSGKYSFTTFNKWKGYHNIKCFFSFFPSTLVVLCHYIEANVSKNIE